MDETLGQRLRRLRTERGLSQRECAGPGVSYAYISRVEAGARTPSVKALRVLAPRLGVSVDYLETGSDDLTVRIPRDGAEEVAYELAYGRGAAAREVALDIIGQLYGDEERQEIVDALALIWSAASNGSG